MISKTTGAARTTIHRRSRTLGMLAGCFSISMLLSVPATGQTRDEVQKLYDEGLALRAAGQHEQALERLRSSLALEHRPQTYLALASSLCELGKTEEAVAALDALYVEFGATMKPRTRAKAEKAMHGTRSARPFERLFIVSPAVTVGTIF